MDFAYIGSVLLLVFGFGFVIFWHELGHFLAAKWAGVKVEQFAVGFGQAMLSWRQGLGIRWGSSRVEYENKLRGYLAEVEGGKATTSELAEASGDEIKLDYAGRQLGISETEYRLNWIPLGGYVKMLGQDDMNPNAQSSHPRSYNNKTIGKRMVIVSAGVIMNIILAIVGFAILFRMGFDAPPAVVGGVQTGSPAEKAGIQVGDRILSIDGSVPGDFNKIFMAVALSEEGRPMTITLRHGNDPETAQPHEVKVTPQRSKQSNGFLVIGITPSPELRGPDPSKIPEDQMPVFADEAIKPGDTIVKVGDQEVAPNQYYVLNQALQAGKPAQVTVRDAQGAFHQRTLNPVFMTPFDDGQINFAGMQPRTVVAGIEPDSSANGKLKPGDVIEGVLIQQSKDSHPHPSMKKLMALLDSAGKQHFKVDMTVIRDGKAVTVTDLDPTRKLQDTGRQGLGIALNVDADHAVIADVSDGSAAAAAGIPAGSTIKSIGGEPVSTWFDVQRLLSTAAADKPLEVALTTEAGEARTVELKLTADQAAAVAQNHYTTSAMLRGLSEKRQTNNPLIAAQWGVQETRDLMLQFYLTLQRMTQGSVDPSNAMGPIGIFHTGSKIANRGTDWLIWFLSMISANLAVVNFLPIPIVDGGLFVFLIIEKIMGKPLSPRAQGIAQIVGLALIASVFIFVTYHDIARLIS